MVVRFKFQHFGDDAIAVLLSPVIFPRVASVVDKFMVGSGSDGDGRIDE